MSFSVTPAPYRRWAWSGLGLAVALDVLWAAALWQRPLSRPTYAAWVLWAVWGLAVIVYAYRCWALDRLAYHVDRNGVYIRWGHSTFVVPMVLLREVHPPGTDTPHFPLRWWRWPALYVGPEVDQGREWHFFATVPPAEQWILCGDRICIGLSPENSQALVVALDRRRALGPNRSLRLGWQRPGLWRWRLWEDSSALFGLLANGLVMLLLWGESVSRAGEFHARVLVTVTTSLVLGNLLLGGFLYRHHRFPTLVLWWVSVFLQVVILMTFWVGVQ